MSNRPLAFADTETTSLDGHLIELAYFIPDSMMKEVKTIRAKNPVPIDLEAMATHHITPGMLEHLPLFKDNPEYRDTKTKLEASLFVAHNAPFDIAVLERDGIFIKESIDTRRVALHLYPELPSHKLQYLRYYLECYLTQEESVAHSADGDVRVLMAVFEKMKSLVIEKFPKADPIGKLVELSNTPVILLKMPFGKYAGKSFQDINREDRNYIEWLYKKVAQDKDLDFKYTVDHWMNRRTV